MAAWRYQRIQQERRKEARGCLGKWDSYRGRKIAMVAEYIRIMKKMSYGKQLLVLMQLAHLLKVVLYNFRYRQIRLRIKLAAIFLAIKFKGQFVRYKKRMGWE